MGFFYVKGHGIPEAVIDNAFQASKNFFQLPYEEKMDVHIGKSPSFKGYEGLLYSRNDPETISGKSKRQAFDVNEGDTDIQIDFSEAFNFGYDKTLDTLTPLSWPWPQYQGLKGENVWPKGLKPDCREHIFRYYGYALNLGRKLIKAFAVVLDLPESYFDDLFVRPGAIMRMLRYPPSTFNRDHPGIGAHRDYECKSMGAVYLPLDGLC